MAKNPRSSTWFTDIDEYVDRGEQCVLWGVPTQLMTREELLAFIGFLDELLEISMKGNCSNVKH